MALSGLDIYKLLPKTNCKKCGFATCLAFAMQIAKKTVSLDKCTFISQEARNTLEAQSLPAIRSVKIGDGNQTFEVGNETVLFRHEEKFFNPSAVGFILDDSLTDEELVEKVKIIDTFQFERVGQMLSVNCIAIRSKSTAERFAHVVRLVDSKTTFAVVLMTKDSDALAQGLAIVGTKKPLVYTYGAVAAEKIAELVKPTNAVVVATAQSLSDLAELTQKLNSLGVKDILLDTGKKSIPEKLWDFTQIRRLALKKTMRPLGYPIFTHVDSFDMFDASCQAATYISKYAGVILLEHVNPALALSLLTLRQNIYTDPQKPLQIEPKVYPVGNVTDKSPVLITTNFSLSYYTVLGEVEASKVPAYIVSIDTEGMSVLTAWAAEKFTPERISDFISKNNVSQTVSHKNLVIPGYVAVLSGDLAQTSGWNIIVGPKEAAGLPSFLKNM